MNTAWRLTTLLSSALMCAPVHSAIDKIPVTDTQDPAVVAQRAGAGWYGWRVPATEGTGNVCCWASDWDEAAAPKGCSLAAEKRHGVYGTRSEEGESSHINVFVQQDKSQRVQRMLVIGDACPLHGDGQRVHWLEAANEKDSLAWLQSLHAQKGQSTDQALHALALHALDAASDVLDALARDVDNDGAEQAVFWLGHARPDGLAHLQELLGELPHGAVRKHINFALTQTGEAEAWRVLKNIVMQDADRDQRRDAVFWLSQDETTDHSDWLLSLVGHSDASTQEQAVFALSQIGSDKALNALRALAGDADQKVRHTALFWLGQVDAPAARAQALEWLSQEAAQQDIEHAAFVLSQLPDAMGTDALFNLLSVKQPKAVRKAALFWLSQSDDPRVIERIASMF